MPYLQILQQIEMPLDEAVCQYLPDLQSPTKFEHVMIR